MIVFSDSVLFKQKINKLNSAVLAVQTTTYFHIDRSEGSAKELHRQGNLDTFAEFHFLSKAKGIVSSSSSFGGSAAAISSLPSDESRCSSNFTNCTSCDFDYFLNEKELMMGGG